MVLYMPHEENIFWKRDAVFIAGVRKCGTTTVFDYLAQFDDIFCPAKFKEPQYFALTDMNCTYAEDWYCGLFDNSSRTILDGSTWIITDPDSVKKARSKFKGKISIITMQRDPVKRTISAFRHLRKKGGDIETRSFSQILTDIENTSGEDLWERENRSILEAEKKGQIDVNYCNKDFLRTIYNIENIDSNFSDRYAMFRYFGESLYDRYIRNLKNVEEDINWLHLDMDGFIQDVNERQRLLDFLGVNAKAEDYPIPHSNQTVNNRVSYKIKHKYGFLYVVAKKILPSALREKIKNKIARNTDQVNAKDYKRAENLFESHK